MNPETKPGPSITIATHLDLRDWFAGQALAGFVARQDYDLDRDELARIVFGLADAMMRERSRVPGVIEGKDPAR